MKLVIILICLIVASTINGAIYVYGSANGYRESGYLESLALLGSSLPFVCWLIIHIVRRKIRKK